MSTLILFCVLGVGPGSPGIVKTKTLSPSEVSRYLAADPEDHVARAMCREAFGSADLAWVERRDNLVSPARPGRL